MNDEIIHVLEANGALQSLQKDALDPSILRTMQEVNLRLGQVIRGEIDASPILERLSKRIYGETHNKTRAQIKIVAQVNVRESPMIAPFLDSWKKEQVNLITSLSRRHVEKVGQILDRQALTGERVESLRSKIMTETGATKAQAQLIARDQTLKLSAKVRQQEHKQLGITRYTWSSSDDERTRQMHKDLDGSVQYYADPPVTNEEGDRNNPGFDFQCRCIDLPYVDDYEALLATNPEEPEPTQPEPTQISTIVAGEGGILGAAGYNTNPNSFKGFEHVRAAFSGATKSEAQAIALGKRPVKVSSKLDKTAKLPPVEVEVYRDPSGKESVSLIDGRHRAMAAAEAGATHIRAVVSRYIEGEKTSERVRILPLGKPPQTISQIERARGNLPGG